MGFFFFFLFINHFAANSLKHKSHHTLFVLEEAEKVSAGKRPEGKQTTLGELSSAKLLAVAHV